MFWIVVFVLVGVRGSDSQPEVQSSCGSSISECPTFQCSAGSCTSSCEGDDFFNDCGGRSLFTCGDTLECNINGTEIDAYKNAVVDTGNTKRLNVQAMGQVLLSATILGQKETEVSFDCTSFGCRYGYYTCVYCFNEITCGFGCSDSVFNLKSSTNIISADTTNGALEAIFDLDYSNNMLKSQEFTFFGTEVNAPHSNNEIYANSSSMRFASLHLSFSQNKIRCTSSNTCADSYFYIDHSTNEIHCTSEACGSIKVVDRDSHNQITCENSSCIQGKFILQQSDTIFNCLGDSCTQSVFDYSFSVAEHNCKGANACTGSTFHAENPKHISLNFDDTTSEDFLISIKGGTAVVKCGAGSCNKMAVSCGDPFAKCALSIIAPSLFSFHCYESASCQLDCHDGCGESYLNCKTAAACEVFCTGNENCDGLTIEVVDNPLKITSQYAISNCNVVNAKGAAMDCNYINAACRGDLFMCNPGSFVMGNIAPVCEPDIMACEGSNCLLSYLEIYYFPFYFHPRQHVYYLQIPKEIAHLEVFVASVDPYSRISIGDYSSFGQLRAYVEVPQEYEFKIDVSICSRKKNTCVYVIYVSRSPCSGGYYMASDGNCYAIQREY